MHTKGLPHPSIYRRNRVQIKVRVGIRVSIRHPRGVLLHAVVGVPLRLGVRMHEKSGRYWESVSNLESASVCASWKKTRDVF